MDLTKYGREILASNKNLLDHWINNCPKSYRLKSDENLLRKNASSLTVNGDDVYAVRLGGVRYGRYNHWIPQLYLKTKIWHVDSYACLHRYEHTRQLRKTYHKARAATGGPFGVCLSADNIVIQLKLSYDDADTPTYYDIYDCTSCSPAQDICLTFNQDKDVLIACVTAKELVFYGYNTFGKYPAYALHGDTSEHYLIYDVGGAIKIAKLQQPIEYAIFA